MQPAAPLWFRHSPLTIGAAEISRVHLLNEGPALGLPLGVADPGRAPSRCGQA